MGKDQTSAPLLWEWIRKEHRIRTLIDIGASSGDFAAFLSKTFDVDRTYAFEPLPGPAAELKAKAAQFRNLTVFPVALSDHRGEESFYRNSYDPASSLLRVGRIVTENFPGTSTETEMKVAVRTLDEMLDSSPLDPEILIKIDVQGLEDRVIKGGRKTFRAARWVYVEMSFEALYEGQPLFEEVHALLVELGFRFKGMKNQVASTKTGQPLFAHCLYQRAD